MSMTEFIKVMKALSDPNRVKILKILQQQSLCVCELQAGLGIAQPTVSNHLKVLEDAGLVHSRKNGLWVNYFVSDGSKNPYVATTLGNLKHWLKDDPEITRILDSLPDLSRETICRRQSA
ncbi:MAG: metalloregulator ArsR/SmtB family transcription factor [Syntrophobacteraceae bacterium]|jgi:ArsR family transcriptional regulator|nr:metalloregulator ArsR/SmtB family transcription factor [Syntrophobacteraceae bacterium]